MLELLQRAALEQVLALLNDPDPSIRLETAVQILALTDYPTSPESTWSTVPIPVDPDEVDLDEMADEPRPVFAHDRDDELGAKARGEVVQLEPATPEKLEEIERKLTEAQATTEQPSEEMPAGFRSGQSGVGPRPRSRKRRR